MTTRDDGTDLSIGELRDARPEPEIDVARRLGIAGVVRRVLGVRRDDARIGGFVLDSVVGRGGMGVVYRAHDPTTGRVVALKLLEGRDERARQRFRREAEVLRSLDHPRIVSYLDHGATDADVDYLAMEWLEGSDLARALESGPLPVPGCIRLGYEAALGLAAAHALGVLHRDVKPSNVILVGGDASSVRLIDFGLAHVEQRGARFTSTGAVLGTPQYMAPEQLRGEESPRTDVYGLGATLYHALVGHPPFDGEHAGSVLLAVASEPPPSPRARRPEIPRDLDALVVRMLAKDPADRPRDMHAVVTELSEWLGLDSLPRESSPTFSLAEREPSPPTGRVVSIGSPWRIRGRARELASLRGELAAAEEEGSGAAVLVLGESGAGRSRLLGEFGAHLAETRPDTRVVELPCDADDAGVPLAGVRTFLMQPGILDHVAGRTARAELDRGLRALRDRAIDGDLAELSALVDRMRNAWFGLVDSLLTSGPFVVLVDDANRLDLSSIRYLRRILEHPSTTGRLLVFAAGPGAGTDELGRGLGARPLARIELGPLGPRAERALLDELAPELADDVRTRALETAAGNPGLLVALAERGGLDLELDATALSVVRNAFGRLAPEARRILRAASLVDGSIPRTLLAQLVGDDAHAPSFLAHLEPLVARGILVRVDDPVDRADGDHYRFTQGPMRRVAYEATTDAARRAGHLRIGAYFESNGDEHPTIALRHFVAAEAFDRAGPLYVRAAERALLGEDTATVIGLVSEGLERVTEPREIGRLEMLRAEAAFWDGDLPGACAAADAAAAHLPPSTREALAVTGLAMTASGQRGRNDDVRSRLGRTLDVVPEPDAVDAWVVAVARGITQLSATSGEDVGLAVERLDAAMREAPRSAMARAWHLRVGAWRSLGDGYGAMLDAWMQAYAAHVEAGDLRSATQIQINLGSLYVWTGAFERAEAVLEDALATCTRIDSGQLRRSAEYTRLKLLAERDPWPKVEATARRVARELHESPRMAAGAELYLGLSALRCGELTVARRSAVRARTTHGAAVIGLASDAIELLSDVASLDATTREARADALIAAHAEAGRLPEFEMLVELACVTALETRLAERDARLVRLDTFLRTEADKFTDPLDRAYFLSRPYAHARISALVASSR